MRRVTLSYVRKIQGWGVKKPINIAIPHPPTISLTLEKISRIEKFLPPQGGKKPTLKAFYGK